MLTIRLALKVNHFVFTINKFDSELSMYKKLHLNVTGSGWICWIIWSALESEDSWENGLIFMV